MTTGAIMMMILAMAVLWGGLALAVFNISRPRPGAGPEADPSADGPREATPPN
ncbi:MAG: methionine/alanine import family NSS transporter small subunit [Ornithinimicrobium sp.]